MIEGILMIFSALLVGAYGVFLLVCYFAFVRLKAKVVFAERRKSVAVVIAARNEEENISRLLQALKEQECSIPFDVILVDDSSEDRTVPLAEAHWARRFQFTILRNSGTGKKDALTTAIHSTPAEVILVTDADCIPDRLWVEKMSEQFNDEQCIFTGGMIRAMETDNSIGASLITETVFLQIVSAGIFALKNPSMCNGASMAFTRKFFLDVQGFANDVFVSGDDMLLLQKAKWHTPNGIRWVTDKNAMVVTPVVNTMGAAIEQRHRWLSKMKAYSDSPMSVVALLFLIIQLLLPLAVLVTFALGLDDCPFWIGVIIKILVELLLLSLAASYFRATNAIIRLPLSAILYCIISIGAVIRLVSGDVTWKGRTWRQGKVR